LTMDTHAPELEAYFHYLKSISLQGRIYKRYFSSPLLFLCARSYGPRIVEVGSGIGSGVLGAFPANVVGLEINPFAVDFSRNIGLSASLINDDGSFPIEDGVFDACILDNVLEHIEAPKMVLDECSRITGRNSGLVICVPGIRGFEWDSDHKVFYDDDRLRKLDDRWVLTKLFSLPALVRSEALSKSIKQYCLVAVYKKV
jgi:SAM-dependent methyltransferase